MSVVAGKTELRSLLGEPSEVVKAKINDRLNELTRQFVERSPFLCLATSAADGTCDVSPRGDPVGFVKVLDERTLLLPDRPGNRLADSFRNVLENPHVALIFIIPGISDTFRVNGRATIVEDPELLEPCAVECRRSASWSRSTRRTRTAPRRSCAPGCGIRSRTSTGPSCRRRAS
jgi:PPOX class probable FMN-dependent enzyme